VTMTNEQTSRAFNRLICLIESIAVLKINCALTRCYRICETACEGPGIS